MIVAIALLTVLGLLAVAPFIPLNKYLDPDTKHRP